MKNTTELLDELASAKRAVIECLKNDTVLVDMHGLTYWVAIMDCPMATSGVSVESIKIGE